MESTGKIIQVMPIQSGISKATGNPWQSLTFVIETLDQYPRKQAFDIFGEERIKQINPQVDQLVKVSFDLESREANGRWFTSARAWKVEDGNAPAAAQPIAAQPMPAPTPAPTPQQAAPAPQQESDTLPF